MCDYSLHLLTSRSAKVGETLVTTQFANSITRGFATAEEPTVAVCLLPGTEVAFEKDVVEYRHFLLPNRKIMEKVARFRQVDVDNPNTHHDALEFPNGQIVLLNRLCEGQRVTVLQLPASPRIASEGQAYTRAAIAGSTGSLSSLSDRARGSAEPRVDAGAEARGAARGGRS
jgi:hypothetical protein